MGDVLLYDNATSGNLCGFHVLRIDAHIADMGESECNDLPGIGGIGQRLLVAGHPRIETDLADGSRLAGGSAEAPPPEYRAIGQHERGGCSRWRLAIGSGRRGWGGHSGKIGQ
jgi:hypothetical protein